MENKVLYFGYGANRALEMMASITGNKNLVSRPAILTGYTLCVQRLDQIPDTVSPGSPAPISPRQLLKESWPDTFESYIIKPGKREDKILGVVWELTPEERELVREWELIDFGWYQDMEIQVKTQDGQKVVVQTEGLREDQEVDREVNGANYETWLNKPEDFARVAEKARREYFERQKKSIEGLQKISKET